MFDPEAFGRAMGEAIRKAVEPLQAKIAELENQLKAQPKNGKDGTPGRDGKDCDMEAVKAMISEAVKAIPVINGKDGVDGKDGDPGRDGVDGAPGRDGTSVTVKDIEGLVKDEVRNWTEGLQIPKDGKDGKDGIDGKDGERGEKGADGIGLAGAMIDREGNLMATMTNGEVKNLGPVVGKDGKDGVDGIGLDSFEMEYIHEAHEISIKASAAGRVKELRYPAGGIRPAGYWRDGTKAKAGEAWTHDGSMWIATKDTSAKPETTGSDWIIGARKGRDGERGQKGIDGTPPAPIKLGS